MNRSVLVRTPCRLHFGMFRFGGATGRQFGGVGLMVEPPCVEVRITPAAQFAVCGALAERARRFAESAIRRWKLAALPLCELRVHSPPDHVGLGIGTQLGLSVAAGLRRFLDLSELPIESLASSVSRGARSAVGAHGFARGGLIVDAGKAEGETLGRLARRVDVPASWRVVLVRLAEEQGLAGQREADAFATLPAVPVEVTRRLRAIANEELLPAAERGDCAVFGDAVYRFGRLAGECFAPVQSGSFSNQSTARLVESIREYGIAGVGQSSWGPTVFAVTERETDARALAAWLQANAPVELGDLTIARPNLDGAQVSSA